MIQLRKGEGGESERERGTSQSISSFFPQLRGHLCQEIFCDKEIVLFRKNIMCVLFSCVYAKYLNCDAEILWSVSK